MGRAGLGRSLAQLTSLVQNPMGAGDGRWWAGRAPGTGSIPRPEMVPFSSSQTSDVSRMEGRGGGREGPTPSHQEPGQQQWQGKQGQLGAAGVRSSQCLAHSKVSHCFLSCSTEPGAGAGLTSCLVFRSKSSKGSLAS